MFSWSGTPIMFTAVSLMKKLQSWNVTLVSVATDWLHLTAIALLSKMHFSNFTSSTLVPTTLLSQTTAAELVDKFMLAVGVLNMYSPFHLTPRKVEFFKPVITVWPVTLSMVKFSIVTFSGLSLLVNPETPVPFSEMNLRFRLPRFNLTPFCVSPLSMTLLGMFRSCVNKYSPLGIFNTFLYVSSVFLKSSVNAFVKAVLTAVDPSGTAP